MAVADAVCHSVGRPICPLVGGRSRLDCPAPLDLLLYIMHGETFEGLEDCARLMEVIVNWRNLLVHSLSRGVCFPQSRHTNIHQIPVVDDFVDQRPTRACGVVARRPGFSKLIGFVSPS
jgi:hypothetical protein